MKQSHRNNLIIDEEFKSHYGFIYITTNKIDGKRYIGQKKIKSNGISSYMGSGIMLSRAIKKYGVEIFEINPIEFCETKIKLDEREKYWIKHYNAILDKSFYNIATGGEGGNTLAGLSQKDKKRVLDKRRKTMLKNKTNLGEKNGMSKLNSDIVLKIMGDLNTDMRIIDISKKYNVSDGSINDIYYKKTWKHLTKNYIFRERHRNIEFQKPLVVVYQYDLNNNFIKKYDSMKEASLVCNINLKSIWRAINVNKNHIFDNFKWYSDKTL